MVIFLISPSLSFTWGCSAIAPSAAVCAWHSAGGAPRARQPVRAGEYAAQVVRRMAPLGRKPGVVEVEPANHRADVERSLHRIELELRAGDPGALGHDGGGDAGG